MTTSSDALAPHPFLPRNTPNTPNTQKPDGCFPLIFSRVPRFIVVKRWGSLRSPPTYTVLQRRHELLNQRIDFVGKLGQRKMADAGQLDVLRTRHGVMDFFFILGGIAVIVQAAQQ